MTQLKESSTAELTNAVKSFTRDDIPALLEQVDSKIKALTGGKEENPPITVPFPDFGDLKNVKDLDKLIKAYSTLLAKEKAYTEAAKECLPPKVKVPPFEIEKISAERWKEFIKDLCIKLAHEKELAKLQSIRKLLEENLSQEAKLAKDLAKMSEILTSED